MASKRSLYDRAGDAVFLLVWGSAGAVVEAWLRRKEARRREREAQQDKEGRRP